MKKPAVTIAIVEDNATRAELYAHWLDHVTVRIALTKRQVLEVVDDDLHVVVLAQEFADGAAEKVLDLVRSRTRFCQVVTTTRDRDRVFPELDVDNHLQKPIFEEDLVETVETVARQTVYAEVLAEYYRTTLRLTSDRRGDGDEDDERAAKLEAAVEDLKPILVGLRADLDRDDMYAVMELVSPRREDSREEFAAQSSKYIPDKCSKCGRQWGVGPGTDPSQGAVRLGSHVWRCVDCGHVQMVSAAGNPRLTHPR